jgi:hypothetical protein
MRERDISLHYIILHYTLYYTTLRKQFESFTHVLYFYFFRNPDNPLTDGIRNAHSNFNSNLLFLFFSLPIVY